jgi:hypothetical protein
MLPAGLGLRVVLGLLASLEPRHDSVLQLLLDDRPTDASLATVRLRVDAGDGEAAGGVNEAPVVGEWDQTAVAFGGSAAPDAAGGHGFSIISKAITKG